MHPKVPASFESGSRRDRSGLGGATLFSACSARDHRELRARSRRSQRDKARGCAPKCQRASRTDRGAIGTWLARRFSQRARREITASSARDRASQRAIKREDASQSAGELRERIAARSGAGWRDGFSQRARREITATSARDRAALSKRLCARMRPQVPAFENGSLRDRSGLGGATLFSACSARDHRELRARSPRSQRATKRGDAYRNASGASRADRGAIVRPRG
jgi:hypothetical protein